ncbi:FUSC family protein [Bradyrhizobium sp. SZCCHNR1070]|uniref:FUSC family protein n=1 Tax=Bradyrhizobium sp. SZCCHNR1070 TaxID=3057361 RepID=UPI002915D74F|nr:FUSC family protein [Bradyrhizobium sp. SZCCHNR1070]
MTIQALARLGFEPPKLAFALRTAIAASLGLLLAWQLGLEHPQWSAMTVWAASQPLRGHLLEKSAARFAGTIVGALFGMGLVLMSRGEPWVLVIGIAAWIGLCAFIGNLVRGYASYAAMLSGYSAAMVALLDAAHPEHVLALGIDRVLTVAVGIVAALIVGLLFASPGDDVTVIEKVRSQSARIVGDLVARLHGAPVSENEQRSILSDIAALEGTLDLHSVGSRQGRRLVKKVRALLAAQVAAVLWLRSDVAPAITVSDQILEGAERCATSDPERALELLRQAIGAADPRDDLTTVLDELAAATCDLGDLEGDSAAELDLHRDWLLARRAMLRAMIGLLATGAIWLATGWDMGGFMMLGTAIMLSIFSTFENPASMLRHVLVGQLLGTAFALICRWLVWPLANGPLELVVAMMPFILLGAPLFAHRLTQRMAFDYNMVLLLMLQPAWPQTMTLEHSLMASLAVIIGPAVGLVAFQLIYPIDSRGRYEAVRTAMIDDLEHLAASALRSTRRRRWRALLHHRILLATYWGERASLPASRLAEDALALLCVAEAIEHLADFAIAASSQGLQRRLTATLKRLHRVGADPARAARALLAAARGLSVETSGTAQVLAQAAGKLIERPAAFRKLRAATD